MELNAEDCWICGAFADSEEHKFKASDLKRYHGKKMDAYYVSGDATKLVSYKDKLLKFPRVICTNCNNNVTRPHDNAYDIFVEYCFKNYWTILQTKILNFEDIYGRNWPTDKANLYRYYAKHAGCKIATSNRKADLGNLAEFIKGNATVNDFILKFELKAGVQAIMNVFNRKFKYHHLYNSETNYWLNNKSLRFGGWLTNNYLTTNWVFGQGINNSSSSILKNQSEVLLLTDQHFFDIKEQEISDDPFDRLKFIDQYMSGFENGYNKTFELTVGFFEKLILLNNKHSFTPSFFEKIYSNLSLLWKLKR